MNEINVSHIKKHTSDRVAQLLMNLLRYRISLKLHPVGRVINRDSGTYLMKHSTSFFDIDEGMDVIKYVQNNPSSKNKDYDYQKFIDVLMKCKADRLKYGDIVPDTTDGVLEQYKEQMALRKKVIPRDFKETREASVWRKRLAREKASEKFRKYNWLLHFKNKGM